MRNIPIEDVLDILYVDELKEVVQYLNLNPLGRKKEMIEEIVKTISPINKFFDLLKSEQLKAICSVLGMPPGTKQEMTRGLLEVVNVEGSQILQPILNLNLVPTFENVYGKLKEIVLSRKKIRSEKDAESDIRDNLSLCFRDVVPQYNLGGYLGLKVDLDINDGSFGIEVKLTESFFRNTSEIFRVFGQAVYYTKKRYGNRFIVAIVGTTNDLEEPIFREAASFLNSIGIQHIGIPIK